MIGNNLDQATHLTQNMAPCYFVFPGSVDGTRAVILSWLKYYRSENMRFPRGYSISRWDGFAARWLCRRWYADGPIASISISFFYRPAVGETAAVSFVRPVIVYANPFTNEMKFSAHILDDIMPFEMRTWTLNKWLDEWLNEWWWFNEWMNEWFNEWMNEWMNEVPQQLHRGSVPPLNLDGHREKVMNFKLRGSRGEST